MGDLAPPAVTFWGAAGSVTGSMHLVEAGGRRILLDCGAVRGYRGGHWSHHREFPFAARDIDAVVLSHAHIDHCGNLPDLVGHGFAGPIYCTPATREILALMLGDSARIQDEEAFVQNVIDADAEQAASPPVSRRHHVECTLQQCVPVPYEQATAITGDMQLRLVDAGHILGSAMVALTLDGSGRTKTLTFTGDLGRRESPLLRAPSSVPSADLVISESTYGGRLVESTARAAEHLATIVGRTVERGGKVLIPAFSLGRTQVVLYCLEEARRSGKVPAVPMFVDSPLAAAIAEVYGRYPESLNPEYAGGLRGVESATASNELSAAEGARYVRSSQESEELSRRREPCIVLAPGGMCDGGRILRHLKQNIDDPRCSVVLVSYQAPHSLGRKLLKPGPVIRFHGRFWNRWADFVELPGFSGHSDHNELLDFLTPLAGTSPSIRLVHGEPEAAGALAWALRERGFANVEMAKLGQRVVID
jgi:metallo-beta-lactamase family protein